MRFIDDIYTAENSRTKGLEYRTFPEIGFLPAFSLPIVAYGVYVFSPRVMFDELTSLVL